MPNDLPIQKSRFYSEFAQFGVRIDHVSVLDGNSGQSTVRIVPDSSTIWGNEEADPPFNPVPITINLVGENEHALLARALRWIADELDRAPRD